MRNWPSDGRTPGIEIRCRRAGSDQDQRQILTASVLIRGWHPFEGRVRNLHCRGAWRVLCMWRDGHYTASHSSDPISSRRHEQKETIFRVSPADRLRAERFKHQIQSPLLPCQNATPVSLAAQILDRLERHWLERNLKMTSPAASIVLARPCEDTQ